MSKEKTTLESLRLLEQPGREAGKSWKDVNHARLLDKLLGVCDYKGWRPGSPEIHLSGCGREMAVTIQVRPPGQVPNMTLGVVNSNTGHKRIRFYMGAVVDATPTILCQVPFSRKHSKGCRIYEAVRVALSHYEACSESAHDCVSALQTLDIDDSGAKSVIVEAGRLKLMPWSRLGGVDRDYFYTYRKSAWNLFLAFCKHAARNPPLNRMYQVNEFRELLEN